MSSGRGVLFKVLAVLCAWSVAAGNYSSRFAGAVAGTVHLAACKLRDKLARIAAAQLRCEPEAVASLRAPIYEEKVVDFLLELVKVTEKKVPREELYKDEDDAKAA